MRVDKISSVIPPDDEELLTTGEVARVLSTSRQHIVDLCERGDLPFITVGKHRRIRRGDVEALRSRTSRMTRDEAQSLWIGYAIAGKLVADPDPVLGKGRENLHRLRVIHDRGSADRWLGEWERLLGGPVEGVLEALTSRSPRARELRQNSPFAGALDRTERIRVLDAFRAHGRRAKYPQGGSR